MKLTDKDRGKIRNYFAGQKDVLAVYVYGSFAKGTARKQSDLDIAVLFTSKIDLYNRLGGLYSEFPKLSISAEPEVRNISLDDSPVYLMNVISGQLIYSKDEIKRIRFEVAILNEFYDTQRLRNIKHFYTKKRLQEGTYGY